ncbi:tRNA-uridine aminocarboxypropyltransferase [Psychromonas sp. Urea-02u-13]|uniref:tRNA-uridine aminocarboxypropyltransferase n=1 Tax=Psychromonas sp. Urea-02u-13 TaxID=2058326 RepID=UPI000C3277DA|nr:tRNA-uridine aminocarboxypropyltransferase [Psychromonas sp. Urea-02u-13]PKG40535.1 DTW domain-containing protein [Psychromonas sp. Urea-02u-13]
MRIHALHKLYDLRLSQSTRPFLARGGRITRCVNCMLLPYLCICPLKKTAQTNSAFLLLMYDDEILKPSNTGRLIADLVPDTFAYIWSRTEPNSDMLALLNDPQWQPMVIFPAEYSEPERLINKDNNPISGKKPLFILLDGSWAQAKKMFRKSPYLDSLPVLSFSPENISRYLVRKAVKDNQLATAEVAALALEYIGETKNAAQLALLFEVFKENYLLGKERKQLPTDASYYKLKSND